MIIFLFLYLFWFFYFFFFVFVFSKGREGRSDFFFFLGFAICDSPKIKNQRLLEPPLKCFCVSHIGLGLIRDINKYKCDVNKVTVSPLDTQTEKQSDFFYIISKNFFSQESTVSNSETLWLSSCSKVKPCFRGHEPGKKLMVFKETPKLAPACWLSPDSLLTTGADLDLRFRSICTWVKI